MQYIAQNCVDAHAAAEECPDLILLDLNLPGMDGFDFLEGLETLGQAHINHRVVVVLTSSAHPKDQQRLNAFSVKKIILKPLTEEKVVELVSKGS